IQCEMETSRISRDEVIAGMENKLVVLEQAVERGIRGVKSSTRLTGGYAVKVQADMKSGKGLCGETILDEVSKAVATNEV
ncbi:L-serine ammonia-lyase, iron-sulfur-dependent, subunit alpha, partial [Bacillus thuringiensis]|nr:L-serine ammonia-lyase, iron-sulfur-dependent, subunit alpha [Bacillus thuringiensis]